MTHNPPPSAPSCMLCREKKKKKWVCISVRTMLLFAISNMPKKTQRTLSTGNVLLSSMPFLCLLNWFMISFVRIHAIASRQPGDIHKTPPPSTQEFPYWVGKVLLEFAYSSLSGYGYFRYRVLSSKVFQRSLIYEVFKLSQETYSVDFYVFLAPGE